MTINWQEANWRKSNQSDSGGCVEVARVEGTIGVRDTKDRGTGSILTFNEREWRAFTGGVVLGQFDFETLTD
jgi:hypothetical protein